MPTPGDTRSLEVRRKDPTAGRIDSHPSGSSVQVRARLTADPNRMPQAVTGAGSFMSTTISDQGTLTRPSSPRSTTIHSISC